MWAAFVDLETGRIMNVTVSYAKTTSILITEDIITLVLNVVIVVLLFCWEGWKVEG